MPEDREHIARADYYLVPSHPGELPEILIEINGQPVTRISLWQAIQNGRQYPQPVIDRAASLLWPRP